MKTILLRIIIVCFFVLQTQPVFSYPFMFGGVGGSSELNDSIEIGDGTESSYTITGNVSGTDPVITLGNSVVNVSTGTLQQGGTAVALKGTLTNAKWCTSDGTVISCTEDAPSGSGDVTDVADCTSGICLNGSSTGGTYVRLYDGTSNYLQLGVGGALGANRSLNFLWTAAPEQGEVFYYNGSAIVPLAHGTAGQVFQSGGHGANPSWVAPSGVTDLDDLPGDTVDNDKIDGELIAPPTIQSVTCNDSGDGNPGALTITPTAGQFYADISVTVNDANGCAITLSESSTVESSIAIITNISAANTATLTTSAGVLTLKMGSPYVLGAKESIILQYKGSEWLELGRTGAFSGVTIGGFTASHIPQINESGVLTGASSTSWGGVILGDSTPDAAGEFGYSSGFSFYGNGEDIKIYPGSADNTLGISSSTGVTDISLGALNLASTGIIAGAIGILSKAANYTIGTGSAKEAYGYLTLVTDSTVVITLPQLVQGMSGCFYGTGSGAFHVDVQSDNHWVLNGTALSAGNKVSSPGTAGDFICFVAGASSTAYSLGRSGTWINGS